MHHQTPFYDISPREQANAQGKTGLRIRYGSLGCAWQLHTWPAGEAAFFDGLRAYFVPPSMGETLYLEDDTLVARTGPLELSLFHYKQSALAAQIAAAIKPELGGAVDLGHAKVCVQVQGQQATQALQKLFALDFRLPHFAIGHFRSTGFHHAPAWLHRLAQTDFDVYLPSTYARDQLLSLVDAALEFGYRLEAEKQ